MAAPTMTFNALGNVIAQQSLAASGTVTSATHDLSAKFEGQYRVEATFGTIAATAGLQVDAYRMVGSTPVVDTNPVTSFVVPAVAGQRDQSFALPTGRYRVKLTNLDATNGLTLVSCTCDTVDTVA